MGKYYLGTGTNQYNFQVVDSTGVINDLNLSGLYLSITGKAADADKLDNYDSSFFRNAANLTGTYTGLVSGKAADSELLDGLDSSYFLNGANITGTVQLSGTFTGYYTGVFSGTISHTDYIQFHTGLGINPDTAELTWSDDVGTMQLGLQGGNVDLRVGLQNYEYVTNRTASTISKGSVIYVSGAQGNRPSISLALGAADTTSANTFGLAAEDIASMTDGYAITNGLLTNLNTTGFAEGAALYLSPTISGAITSTKPQAPQHSVLVGFCVRSHQSAGEILVKIQNGLELDELHDVRILNKQNNDIIRYNAPSGIWYNSDTLAINGTGANYISGDLGIGTSGPTAKLHILGADKRQIIASTTDNAALVLGQWDGATNRIESSTRKLLITSYANGISLGINGSENVHVSTSGYLGVGTLTPAEKLHVNAGAGLPIRLVSSSYAGIEYHNINGTWKGYIGTENGGGGLRYNSADSQHTFYNDSAAVLRINSSGDVGINTTNPTAKLNVHKAFTQSGLHEAKTFSITTDNGTSNWTLGQIVGYVAAGTSNSASGFPGGLMFKTKAADSNAGESGVATRMVINAAGNVGINTTDPSYKLQVYSGADEYAIAWSRQTSKVWAFGSDSAGTYINNRTDSVLPIYIKNAGNIGIGTTDPQFKLDVNGIISIAQNYYLNKGFADGVEEYLIRGSAGSWNGFISYTPSSSTTNRGFKFGAWDNGGNRNDWISIWNGDVGIGVTAPSQKLEVRGNIKLGGDNSGNYIYYVTDIERTIVRTTRSDVTQEGLMRSDGWGNFTFNKSIAVGYSLGSGPLTGNIYASGSVGIGTPAPSTKLEVLSGIANNVNGLPIAVIVGPNQAITSEGSIFSVQSNTDTGIDIGGSINLGGRGTAASVQAGAFAHIAGRKENATSGNFAGYLQFGTSDSASDVTERMRITSDGNVGIGITNPGDKLTVVQNSNDTIIRSKTTTAGAWFVADSANDGYFGLILDQGATEKWRIGQTDGTADLSIKRTGSDVVRIKSTGNFLINSISDYRSGKLVVKSANVTQTSSLANLHVSTTDNQGIDIGGSIGLGGKVSTTDETPFGYISGRKENALNANYAGYLAFATQDSGASIAEWMRITSVGRVGIGTTTPTAKLEVNGSISLSGDIRSAWGNRGFTVAQYPDNFGTSPDYYMGLNVDTNSRSFYIDNKNIDSPVTANQGDIYFRTGSGPTTKMAITYGGNVGIGTTSPAELLDIAASANNGATAGPKINFKKGSTNKAVIGIGGNYLGQATNTDDLIFRNDAGSILFGFNGSEKMRINTDGQLMINTGAISTFSKLNLGNGGIDLQVDATTTTSTKMNANATNNVLAIRAPFNATPAATGNANAKWGIWFSGGPSYDTVNYPYTSTEATTTALPKSAAIYAVSEDSANGYNRQVGLAFYTSNFDANMGERVRIDRAGNVGIGATSPKTMLDVYNNSDIWHFMVGGGTSKLLVGGQAAGGVVLQGGAASTANNAAVTSAYNILLQRDGGNVGIGNAAASYKLHIGDNSATASAHMMLDGVFGNTTVASHARIYFNDTNFGIGAGGWASSGSDDDLYLWTYDGTGRDIRFAKTSDGTSAVNTANWTTNMIIKNDGSVGIGTITPLYNLEVAKASAGATFAVNADTVAAGEASIIAFTSKQYNTYYKAAIIAYDPHGGSYNRRGLAFCVNNTLDGTSASYASDKALYIAPDKSSTFYNNVDINGTANIRVSNDLNWYLTTGTNGTAVSLRAFNNAKNSLVVGEIEANPLRINTIGGNVGIGVTAPNAKLEVNGVILGKNFTVPDPAGTPQWCKLGTATLSQGGHTIRIKAYLHAGYNARNDQDFVVDIFLKTSNFSSVDANGFAGNSWFTTIGYNGTDIQAKWKANAAGVSAASYDLYIYLPAFTLGSHYEVSVTDLASGWLHTGSLGQTDPGSGSTTVCVASKDFNVMVGNVGIGTNSPTQILEAYRSQNTDTALKVTNVNGGNGATAQFFASNGTTQTQLYHTGTGYTTNGVIVANQGGMYTTSSAGLAIVANHASGVIKFATGGVSEAMRIASDKLSTFYGNVLVSKASPELAIRSAVDTSGEIQYLTFGSPIYNRAQFRVTSAGTSDGSAQFYTFNAGNPILSQSWSKEGHVTFAQNVTVSGDFTVNGTTTTVNTTTLDVKDLNITVAKGAANAIAANGAGLTVDGANATILYQSTGDKFVFNKPLEIPGGTIVTNTQASSITGTLVSYVTPGLYANAISTGNAIGIISNTTFANNGAWGNIGLHQVTASANDITAGVHMTIGGWYQNSASGLPIYLGCGYISEATPTMVVKPANASGGGNVGIGTISPSKTLHIVGGFFTQSNSAFSFGGNSTSGNVPLNSFFGDVGTTITDYTLGVGRRSFTGGIINAEDIIGGVHFFGTGTDGSTVTVGAAIEAVSQGVNSWGNGGSANTSIRFLNRNNTNSTYATLTETVRIKNNGNVGIGVTDPSAKLEVAGNVKVSSGLVEFGSKSHTITNSYTTGLTINLNSHTGVFIRVTIHGDLTNNSAIAYMGEFFIQNGYDTFAEPGMVVREVNNTNNGSAAFSCQIVDPSGVGTRNFEMQFKQNSATASVGATIIYHIQGNYNSIS